MTTTSDSAATEIARLHAELSTQTEEAVYWRTSSERLADSLRDAEAHARELQRMLDDAEARLEELRKRNEELEGELEVVRRSGGFG